MMLITIFINVKIYHYFKYFILFQSVAFCFCLHLWSLTVDCLYKHVYL